MIETTYLYPHSPYIALLGDFHNGEVEPVVTSLRQHQPELICIAGDLVYARAPHHGLILEEQQNAMLMVQQCMEIAPTFMSLGNHEYMLCDSDYELLKNTGVEILDNRWTSWNGISIGGLTSQYVVRRKLNVPMDQYPKKGVHYRKKINEPDLSWISPVPEGFSILLSHHPEYYPKLSRIDLILSAHAHGGQIRFFNHGLFAPGQGWWPKYTKGQYGNMIVTAGLTNTADVPRINNPTEIVYIRSEE